MRGSKYESFTNINEEEF